uniref:hypothetical protein n=1 Tax=uncultured Draconibacterium sp. TaxID=1573823 RepID=UPI0032168B13
MKNKITKALAVIALIIATTIGANAQEIGARFGEVSAGNIAIDGIFSTGDFSRVHADLSFGDGMSFDILWDFIYRPLGDQPIYYYIGVGPYIWINDPFWLGAVGEAGLEYHFESVPIALGIDWRPAISIIEETDIHFEGFGFNIRYVFGY